MAHVLACEDDGEILSEQAAGNTVGIAVTQLLLSQIGADDGGEIPIDSGVDNVVKAGDRILRGHLRAQVVHNEKFRIGVAGQVGHFPIA